MSDQQLASSLAAQQQRQRQARRATASPRLGRPILDGDGPPSPLAASRALDDSVCLLSPSQQPEGPAAFHKNFPHLAATEDVLHDYQCSYSKNKLHRVGRIFLTSKHICFCSLFCEAFAIAFSDVIDIHKKANLLLLEAIAIRTAKEEHFFTAFLFRDQAFQAMVQLLSAARCASESTPPPQPLGHKNPSPEVSSGRTTPPLRAATPTPADQGAVVGSPSDMDPVSPRPRRPHRPAISTPPPSSLAPVAADDNSNTNNNTASLGTTVMSEGTLADTVMTSPVAVDPTAAPTVVDGVDEEMAAITEGVGPGPLVDVGAVHAASQPVNLAATTTEGCDNRRSHHVRTPSSGGAEDTRLVDFRKQFPHLPPNERLINDFQCSYIPPNHIHRMGRMYITTSAVCFFSMFCGAVTIPFSDITMIDKNQSMMILNGVMIQAGATSYVFTSFYNRELAHDILQQQWALVKGIGAKKLQKEEQKARNSVVRDQPQVDDDDDSEAPSVSPARQADPAAAEYPAIAPAVVSSLDDLEGADFKTADGVDYCEHFSSIATIKGRNKPMITKEITLPKGIGIDGVHHLLYSDQSSFIRTYHAKRRDFDMTISKWATAKAGAHTGYRTFNCTTNVSAPFSIQTPYCEWERYDVVEMDGLRKHYLRFCGQTPDVMLGSTFRVESVVEVVETKAASCTLMVWGNVQFLKSTWMKGKIESTALGTESPAAYKIFAAMATEHIRKSISATAAAKQVAAAGPAGTALNPAEVAEAAVTAVEEEEAGQDEEERPKPIRGGGGVLPALEGLVESVSGGFVRLEQLVAAFLGYVFLMTMWYTLADASMTHVQQQQMFFSRMQTLLMVLIVCYLMRRQ
eukprot:PhM_4_TR176/c0_g1_i1/m.64498